MSNVITEAEICNALDSHFVGNSVYRLANAFIFKHNWESDFFVQKQNGYAYEFEVKVSRSDFFSDKKKVDKHMILNTGMFMHKEHVYNENYSPGEQLFTIIEKEKEHSLRPNKFFYVVPEGMITVEEVPSYAGLYYYIKVGDSGYKLIKKKDAPFIHKEKNNYQNILCKKFYHYWLEERYNKRMLQMEIKKLNRELDKLKLVNS